MAPCVAEASAGVSGALNYWAHATTIGILCSRCGARPVVVNSIPSPHDAGLDALSLEPLSFAKAIGEAVTAVHAPRALIGIASDNQCSSLHLDHIGYCWICISLAMGRDQR